MFKGLLLLLLTNVLSPNEQSCARLLAESWKFPIERVEAQLDDPATTLCLENVPPVYRDYPSFLWLAGDSDQKRVTKQSIREAMGAIELVRSGRIPGPIDRAENHTYSDYVDGSGEPLDIKAKSSPRGPNGNPYDAKKFYEEEVRGKLDREVTNRKTGAPTKIRIFIDKTWLTAEDLRATEEVLREKLSPDELTLIHYFELPEPLIQFRAPDKRDKKD